MEDSRAGDRRQGADSAQVAAVQPSVLLSEGLVGPQAGIQQFPLDTSTAGSGSKSLSPVAGVAPAATAPGQQPQAQDQGPGKQAAGPEETPAQQQTPEGHLEPELSGGAVAGFSCLCVHLCLPRAVMPFRKHQSQSYQAVLRQIMAGSDAERALHP